MTGVSGFVNAAHFFFSSATRSFSRFFSCASRFFSSATRFFFSSLTRFFFSFSSASRFFFSLAIENLSSHSVPGRGSVIELLCLSFLSCSPQPRRLLLGDVDLLHRCRHLRPLGTRGWCFCASIHRCVGLEIVLVVRRQGS
jgi:hypothetical protein